MKKFRVFCFADSSLKYKSQSFYENNIFSAIKNFFEVFLLLQNSPFSTTVKETTQ